MRAIGSDYQLRELDVTRPHLETVIPPHYQEDYPKFVEFMKGYFEYLQQTEGFGDFVSRLKNIKDADLVDPNLLEALKQEYGPGFPDFTAIDDSLLIRIFEYWYRSKGTEEGIVAYFRLFLNSDAEIVYPKDNILRVSDGIWLEDEGRYSSGRGHLSETTMVIQDSYFYQIFSYLVKSSVSTRDWGPTYKNLAHMAGSIFFGRVELKETAFFNFDTFSPNIVPGWQIKDSKLLIISAAMMAMGCSVNKILKIITPATVETFNTFSLRDVAINIMTTTYTIGDLSSFTIEQFAAPGNKQVKLKGRHPARIIISESP